MSGLSLLDFNTSNNQSNNRLLQDLPSLPGSKTDIKLAQSFSETINQGNLQTFSDINQLPGVRDVVGALFAVFKIPGDLMGMVSLLADELPNKLVEKYSNNPSKWADFIERNFGGWKGGPLGRAQVYDWLKNDPPSYKPGDASSFNRSLFKIEVALALKLGLTFSAKLDRFGDKPLEAKVAAVFRTAVNHIYSGVEDTQGNFGAAMVTMLFNVSDFVDVAGGLTAGVKAGKLLKNIAIDPLFKNSGGLKKIEKAVEAALAESRLLKKGLDPENTQALNNAERQLRNSLYGGDKREFFDAFKKLQLENTRVRDHINSNRVGDVSSRRYLQNLENRLGSGSNGGSGLNLNHADIRNRFDGFDPNITSNPRGNFDSFGNPIRGGAEPGLGAFSPTRQELLDRKLQEQKNAQQIVENGNAAADFEHQQVQQRQQALADSRAATLRSDAIQATEQATTKRNNEAIALQDQRDLAARIAQYNEDLRKSTPQYLANEATSGKPTKVVNDQLIINEFHEYFKVTIPLAQGPGKFDFISGGFVDAKGNRVGGFTDAYGNRVEESAGSTLLNVHKNILEGLSNGGSPNTAAIGKLRKYSDTLTPVLKNNTHGISLSAERELELANIAKLRPYGEAATALATLKAVNNANPPTAAALQKANDAVDTAKQSLSKLGDNDAVALVNRAQNNINKKSFEFEVPSALRRLLDAAYPDGWRVGAKSNASGGLIYDSNKKPIGSVTANGQGVTFRPIGDKPPLKQTTVAADKLGDGGGTTAVPNNNGPTTVPAKQAGGSGGQDAPKADAGGGGNDINGGNGGKNKPKKTGGNGNDGNVPDPSQGRIDLTKYTDHKEFLKASAYNFNNHPLGQLGRGPLSGGGRAKEGLFKDIGGKTEQEIIFNVYKKIDELVAKGDLTLLSSSGNNNKVYKMRDGTVIRVGNISSTEILLTHRLNKVITNGNYRLGVKVDLDKSLYLATDLVNHLKLKRNYSSDLNSSQTGTSGVGVLVLENAGESFEKFKSKFEFFGSKKKEAATQIINAIAHLNLLNHFHLDAHDGNFLVKVVDKKVVVTVIDYGQAIVNGKSALGRGVNGVNHDLRKGVHDELVYLIDALDKVFSPDKVRSMYREAIEKFPAPTSLNPKNPNLGKQFEDRRQLLLRAVDSSNY